MARGRCLCGAVRYTLDRPMEEIDHCHCSMCRRFHGAAFSTYGRVAREALGLEAGEDRLTRYRSSDEVERSFCSQCGSSLFFAHAALPDALFVAVGTIEGDPGLRPSAHIFVGSKAPWLDIHDDLPRHEAYPPGAAD